MYLGHSRWNLNGLEAHIELKSDCLTDYLKVNEKLHFYPAWNYLTF